MISPVLDHHFCILDTVHPMKDTRVIRKNTLILAPLADISHAALRHLILDFGGCGYFFSEMISATGIISKNQFEPYYEESAPVPEQLIFQIVGSTVDDITKAARLLAEKPVFGIDVNMGCTAHSITKLKAGIEWMDRPQEAQELMQELKRTVKGKSISAKIRLGRKADKQELLSFCQGLQDGGADFITLHPRTRSQTLSRPSEWSWVSFLSEELDIPVIGNGDIKSGNSFCQKSRAGAQAYMIGRAAVQKPWIFHQIQCIQQEGIFKRKIDLFAVWQQFREYLQEWQPEEFWATRAKRFLYYFCDNLKFSHLIRTAIYNADSLEDIHKTLENHFLSVPGERFLHVKESIPTCTPAPVL
ncbi:MAG: tRNA-dihydrouridine synthase family protein [Spirochaetia bacterium]